ncbi:MAG: hypothetical protein NT041_01155 [Candidatus Vogelbacteria bacterium]|nr:hypothetical protein [Candidatus Vogelbacteria bacterium]
MKKNTLVIVAIIILVIVVGGLYYWSTQSKLPAGAQPAAVGAVAQDPAAAAASEAQAKAILAKLAVHMVLPTGEVPQIGQIDDPVQAAKAQPFVAGAIKGDLLIVYVKAAKAIVYSPSRDLVVNVGPVSMNPEKPATAPVTTPAPAKTPVKQ